MQHQSSSSDVLNPVHYLAFPHSSYTQLFSLTFNLCNPPANQWHSHLRVKCLKWVVLQKWYLYTHLRSTSGCNADLSNHESRHVKLQRQCLCSQVRAYHVAKGLCLITSEDHIMFKRRCIYSQVRKASCCNGNCSTHMSGYTKFQRFPYTQVRSISCGKEDACTHKWGSLHVAKEMPLLTTQKHMILQCLYSQVWVYQSAKEISLLTREEHIILQRKCLTYLVT